MHGCGFGNAPNTSTTSQTRSPQPAQDTNSGLSPMAMMLQRRLKQSSKVDSMSINESLQELRSMSAISPDRRFLNAVSLIHQLATGSEPDVLDVQFKTKTWKVVYQNQPVGDLHELPTFEELHKLLLNWASKNKKTIAKTGTIDSELARVKDQIETSSPESLFAALSKLDELQSRGETSLLLLKLKTRALAILAWEMLDNLEIGDEIFSTALAHLVFVESAYPDDVAEEKALLADALGYEGDAKRLAKTLPAESALACYLNNQNEKLRQIAQRETKSCFPNLLYFRSTCLNRDKSRWREWLAENSGFTSTNSLPPLKCTYAIGDEAIMMPIAIRILGDVKLASEGITSEFSLGTGDLEWRNLALRLPTVASTLSPNLLADFEKGLAGRKEKGLSDFAVRLRSAFYRAYFFSAMDIVARTTLALPSAKVFSERLSACLEYQGSGPSAQLGPWVLALSSPNGGADEAIESAFLNLNHLGPSAMLALLPQAKVSLPASKKWSNIRDLFFVRIDSRPEVRLHAADFAELPFLDLTAHKALVASALRDGAGDSLQSKLVLNHMLGRKPEIMKLFNNASLTQREKLELISIVRLVDRDSVKDANQMYGKLLRENPTSWEVEKSFIEFVADRDKKAAISELRKWKARVTITKKDGAKVTRDALALDQKLLLAQLLYETGDIAGLKNELKSLKSNSSQNYLKLLALSELSSGNYGSAKAWAEELRRSFPRSLDSMLVELEICLKQKQFLPAANLLRAAIPAPRIIWKEKIGTLVISKLSNPQDVGAFVGALDSVQINSDDNLGQIAAAAYSADKAELAFQILSTVKTNPDAIYDMLTCQYRYLKRAKGKQKALAWLKEQIPEDKRAAVAPYAFFSGQDELLFEFAPAEDPLAGGEEVWLLRAASGVLNPIPANWQSMVNAHFDGSKDFDGKLGLYLLGKLNAQQLSTLPLTAAQRAKASFYLAWKQMAEPGNFLADTELLLVCLATNQYALSEYQWSKVWLRDIAASLAGQPMIYSEGALSRLRVVSPSQQGDWSQQRRFQLSNR